MKKIFKTIIFLIVFIAPLYFIFTYFAYSYFSNKTDDGNIEHFSNAIDYSNQAAQISNENHADLRQKHIDQIITLYNSAIEEAKKVNIAELNADLDGFGTHFQDEFIKGLELQVEGFNGHDNKKLLQGQILSDKWGEWYTENYNQIKKI